MTPRDVLRKVPLFAELSEADLALVAANAKLEEVAADTCIMAEGSPPASMFVVVEGELVVTKRGATGPVVLNTCGPGDLLGELSVLENRPRSASVTAIRPSVVVVLGIDALHDLLRASLTATLAILRTMAARLGNTEGVLRQNDQLASLGRMAAGIAHEFNNPASAVKRGAVELHQRLAALEAVAFELRTVALDDAQVARLRVLGEPRPAIVEDAMQRARREQALEQALAARKLPQVWELAPTLAALHWDVAAVDEVAAAFPAAAIGPVVRWIEAVSSMRLLASDVADAATRISDLVDAVRSHSHLGEAPIQRVELHHQLDTTLRLLRHKLANVEVRRDFAADLPPIEAYGSELNQVWTNLIDNALQAMEGRPARELVIATSRADGDHVAVAITDNGPGIPADIQSEIYKPFFTTKAPGAGTGLGLHLAYNIIVRKHRGRLELESRPGHTCFRVVLPLRAGEVPR